MLALVGRVENQGMEAVTDEEVRKAIGDTGPGGEEDGVPGHEEPFPIEDDMSAIPGAFAHVENWDRTLVDAGPGTTSVKVYFTGVDASGQRGFTPCPATNTCKWMQISLLQSKPLFCSYMYLWYMRSVEEPDISREAHTSFVPDAALVEATAPTMHLWPF